VIWSFYIVRVYVKLGIKTYPVEVTVFYVRFKHIKFEYKVWKCFLPYLKKCLNIKIFEKQSIEFTPANGMKHEADRVVVTVLLLGDVRRKARVSFCAAVAKQESSGYKGHYDLKLSVVLTPFLCSVQHFAL